MNILPGLANLSPSYRLTVWGINACAINLRSLKFKTMVYQTYPLKP